jgi:hypothetical protein
MFAYNIAKMLDREIWDTYKKLIEIQSVLMPMHFCNVISKHSSVIYEQIQITFSLG